MGINSESTAEASVRRIAGVSPLLALNGWMWGRRERLSLACACAFMHIPRRSPERLLHIWRTPALSYGYIGTGNVLTRARNGNSLLPAESSSFPLRFCGLTLLVLIRTRPCIENGWIAASSECVFAVASGCSNSKRTTTSNTNVRGVLQAQVLQRKKDS